MHKKLLAVFAHPDDEAFGPAGTLAYYAKEGVEIHLLCATRGEAGENRIKNYEVRIRNNKAPKTPPRWPSLTWTPRMVEGSERVAKIREKELLKSAKILGIKKVEFLDFIDGELRNNIYHQVAEKIINKIHTFKPQVVLTVERRGVSGHLDHIAISMITTYSYLKTKEPKKLYYHCLPFEMRDKMMDNYFVYFPEGYSRKEITTKIDYSCCWEEKVKSMKAHQSQIKDVKNLLNRFQKWPKVDHFILQYHRGVKVSLPETDLFAGIDH
ncbi:PIG-L family deacetylase [Candidatus Gottesmanbacteria bacterium]|nr:PIG-L family deacetylase [Candidatus Gottesmanbacteria bacterium]MBI5452058.1 PIG-L family deacetylase [Candidatus Gottesmanbacteria bacterium]